MGRRSATLFDFGAGLGLLWAWGPDQGFATTENKETEWPAPEKLINKLW
jgi:hypothetical protein